ncbi:hypothetical protein DITRI_Ditri17bG0129700 [Diplodiscus trichospermus]
MASGFYRFNRLYHQVFQPNTIPETRYPASRFVQIELTITLDLLIHRYDRLTHQYIDSYTDFFEETLRFDLHLLKTHNQAFQILVPILSRLRIIPDNVVFDAVMDDIMQLGITMRDSTSNRGRRVLPLRAELWGIVEQHVNNGDESVLMRRALEESALESFHGMVPADKSSAKKMVKRVRVEDDGDQCKKGEESNKKRKVKGEDCVICLEELKIGSTASRMPCFHTFHSICINKWLEQSHYCPICRFEMPT